MYNFLLVMCATLQLRMLDPKFYHCVEYYKLAELDDKGKDNLIDFLHPTIISPSYDKMIAKVRPANVSTSTAQLRKTKNFAYFEFQLASRLMLIDDLCAKK
jgi:hypothetical protein